MSRAVIAWCRAYTTIVPEDARDRRREEITSFVWEAKDAGLKDRRVFFGAMKGAVDDLRWCQAQRSRASLLPVSATIGGSTAIAGLLILVTYVGTWFVEDSGFVLRAMPLVALVVLLVAYINRVRDRSKPPNNS